MRGAANAQAVAALAVVAVGLSSCAVMGGPVPRPQTPSAVADAQTTHEYRSVTGPPGGPAQASPQGTSRGWSSAVAAVTAFARAYTNWDVQTIGRQLRALAAESVGQARSAMQLAAAEASSDYELQRGGIANHGSVEAVAALSGGRDRYVVVTRELTTATATTEYQGLQPAWHVTIATVVQQPSGRWVVSGWQPQS